MENLLGSLDPVTILFLVVAGFISAFIDSTVGGGGLISTPALLSLGLPVPYALGTNKVAASVGAFTSVISFWRAGKIKKAALALMRRKDWGDIGTVQKLGMRALISAFIMAFGMGFYDGFFGPGTGSFLIFGFLYLGYDFVTAAGNAKALNFASGVGALVAFAMSGTIVWSYGLIMASAMVVGALCGSRLAIKKGASYVRPLYLLVTTLLIGKQVYEILFK